MEQLRSRREVLYAVVVPEAPTEDIFTDICTDNLHDEWMDGRTVSDQQDSTVTWYVDLSVSAQQRGQSPILQTR